MSVRRLAEASVQPPSFAFEGGNVEWAERTIAKYPAGRQQSAVIPLLMRAQDQDGWVTKAAIETIATMLDMPTIRVLEVATFYTQYQLKPVGTKAHVQVCGTTPCMLRGSEALMDVCRSKIHHDQFHTNASGTLSWEEVECLGACVNAPMVMVFKDTYEDLTPETLGRIIDAFEAGDPPQPGPQVDRHFSAPETGYTSLKDEQAVLDDVRAWRERDTQPQPAADVQTPPSNAAKPKTDAVETNPAIKSPSPEKVTPGEEKAVSASPPEGNAAAANAAEPSVEGVARQRRGPRKPAETEAGADKAPELHKGGPIGADAKGGAKTGAGKPGMPSAGTDAARDTGKTDQD